MRCRIGEGLQEIDAEHEKQGEKGPERHGRETGGESRSEENAPTKDVEAEPAWPKRSQVLGDPARHELRLGPQAGHGSPGGGDGQGGSEWA